MLATTLTLGVTVFAFDFSGCGQSDGEYISLGYFERGKSYTSPGSAKSPNGTSLTLHISC
jgi:hypothetical protein